MTLNEEREIVTMIRRKSDPATPTISDVLFGDLKFVVLERPRAPAEKDFAKVDGKPHPCIPAGVYDVDWTENVHPEHPACYQVMNVPDRTDILIHSANWIRQLLGCLAPGARAEVVEGSWTPKGGDREIVKEFGVSASGPTLTALCDKLCRKNFRLIIKEAV